MRKIYIKYNLVFIYFIIFLTINHYTFSKTSNNNQFSFTGQNKDFIKPKEDEYYVYDNIYQEYEKLFETIQKLEKDIDTIVKKNQDYLLKTEVNKIYIKFLYFLILILVFIIIAIIAIKFYFLCNKKENLKPFFGFKS